MSDYSQMTMDELTEEMYLLTEERSQLKARAVEVQRWMDRKTALAKVDAMTDAEREQLRQILGVSGIASDEEFGVPGA